MSSSGAPEWAVGDYDDEPTRNSATPAFALDDDGERLVPFSIPWWTKVLAAEPLTGSIAERRRLRGCVVAAVEQSPGSAQMAALETLLTVVNANQSSASAAPEVDPAGLGLSSREWTEVIAASDRCASYLYALQLNFIAGLDTAKLAEQSSRATWKDSRRPASDELAPVLRISGRSATALVGQARQLCFLPAAEEALVCGVMTPSQWRELVTVCRRLPEGVEGERARRVVEATAVAAAATLSRARLAATLEEAALAADPGYAARAMAAGINDRDVVLRASPLPGCARIVADMELGDATRVWQVINQIAANALAGDTENPDAGDGDAGEGEPETRTKGQLRADALASLVLGDIEATPVTIAQALGDPVPGEAGEPTEPAADRSSPLGEELFADGGHADDLADDLEDTDDDRDEHDVEDFDEDDEGDEGDESGSMNASAARAAADNRAPVRIPTPEQRARLSEIHIVVLADDLIDDDLEDPDGDEDSNGPEGDEGPEDPDSGPDDPYNGPDEEPDGPPDDGPDGRPGDGGEVNGPGGWPDDPEGPDDWPGDLDDWPDTDLPAPEPSSQPHGHHGHHDREPEESSGSSATPPPAPTPTSPPGSSPPSSTATATSPPGGRDRPRPTNAPPTSEQPAQCPAHRSDPTPPRPNATGTPPPAPNRPSFTGSTSNNA
ncbi:hypothetical protein SAMN06264364_1061, partial [Quadrisphaera granulorum]